MAREGKMLFSTKNTGSEYCRARADLHGNCLRRAPSPGNPETLSEHIGYMLGLLPAWASALCYWRTLRALLFNS